MNEYSHISHRKIYTLIIIILITTACLAQIEKEKKIKSLEIVNRVEVDYQKLYSLFIQRKLANPNFKAKVKIGLYKGKKKKYLRP